MRGSCRLFICLFGYKMCHNAAANRGGFGKGIGKSVMQ